MEHLNGIPNQNIENNTLMENKSSLEAITKIRELFQNGPLEEALAVINSSPQAFINNLVIVNKEDIHLCQQLLQLFRDKTPQEFNNTMISHLRSTSLPVRQFAIEQIYNLLKEEPDRITPVSHKEAFAAIAELLGDADTQVFNNAILILSQLDLVKYPDAINLFDAPLNGNCSSKCNTFDVIVKLSMKSEDHLNKCSPYIDKILDELVMSKDILYMLNLLEFLSDLVVTPQGFAYFNDRQIFETISDLMHAAAKSPLKGLILPGYFKFFGAVAHLHATGAFCYYPSIVETLMNVLETSDDRSLLIVALDTLGYVGNSLEGKLCLTELGAQFQSIVSKVSEYIRNSPTEIKVRALNCMEGIISIERDREAAKSGPVNLRITLMTREWFRTLNPQGNPMVTLYEFCKNPFPDIRLAAFGLLDAVCQHQWGAEMVATTPGFIEFLLDRSVDHNKESKEAKYAIIKRLSRLTAFDPSVTIKMTSYLDQGVFYSETGLEVAMEEDN